MTTLDALILTHQPQKLQRNARVVMGLLGAFLLWACFAKLEEVAVAGGEVVPQEQIQTIQHLEGGIIEKIMVAEGDRVVKGQPMMQMNLTPSMANKSELKIQLEANQLKKARLEAESEGAETFRFGSEFDSIRTEMKNAEMQAFTGRQEKLQNDTAQLQEQLTQRELDRQQLLTERSSIGSNLALLREKYRISSDLVKDQLTSRLDHLQLTSNMKELEGRMRVIDVAIPRSAVALKEAEEKLKGARVAFRNAALQELSDVSQSIARIQEALTKASDQVARTTITSPLTGVVKALKTHTIGGVIQPGEAIMEIVPESKNLIIEAKLNPNDVGFVRVGQKVLVKVNTYDFSRYGGLDGKVESVSADSLFDPNTHAPYFKVKIRTHKTYLGESVGQSPITAGMQVTADIKTGSKSVMSYLLKPLLKIRDEAFRER
jgi:adhesin transport system membrane fusion protein